MSIITTAAVISRRPPKMASKNPGAAAAPGFSACCHFRLHVMAYAADMDGRVIYIIVLFSVKKRDSRIAWVIPITCLAEPIRELRICSCI